ncbi:hypothetical protein B0H67DRAFT_588930 [Lasiosphaeris hirsuta]|uniref:Nudix hydrolase domain-containing protein n=1 Tax=Lasiosphaeris hirsuta TaxID=260670 RepID=A0AA40DLU7_9PEZI|nr:hypothetical protein B0H67DRAFT_588930 [Lasiosphaeris hirsuta]
MPGLGVAFRISHTANLKAIQATPWACTAPTFSQFRLGATTAKMSTQTQPNTTAVASAALKKRAVVSSFIFKFDQTPDGRAQVALFRRSGKVSTYRHHLAPISGSIEPSDPSPLAAAWREIGEETTLDPSSLTLIRQGKNYTFSDVSVGREWTIFPFAFRLKTTADEGRITIDWEHEGWGWFDPLAVVDNGDFGGVPRLAESLRRVWFEKDLGEVAGKVLSDGLARLATDYKSGARQLAGVALETLRDVIAVLEPCSPSEQWWANVRSAAWHIWKNGRESMGAAIVSALLAALSEISDSLRSRPPGPWLTTVTTILNRRLAARKHTSTLVSQSLAAYLSSTPSPLSILTLSQSSTITHALHHLSTIRPLDLRILESRPLFEGVSLASSLASPQTTITLHTDASAALASKNLTLVLLGADRISASGAVSNKTGSLPAVLSAGYVSPGVKVIVLCDAEKVAGPGRPEEHVVEDSDAGQVTSAWAVGGGGQGVRGAAEVLGAEVAVRNTSFEWVPAELVDVYITEFGEWGVKDIASQSQKLADEEERMFGHV